MGHSCFDRWLACFAVVLLAGCTDSSTPTTDATADYETTTVSSSGEIALTDETTDSDAEREAEQATSEISTLTIGDAAPPLGGYELGQGVASRCL